MSTRNSPEEMRGKPPVALIAGPTASGKSAAAMALADAIAARGARPVIVNADSMQVYRDIPVLSAAPDPADMARHAHRLYLEWDGARACSAADWAACARKVVDEVHDSGGVPVLVGGTGMYTRTLLDGIAPIPPIDADVRKGVRALSTAEAYAALETEDPARAARLEPGDSQRIARALEVVRSTGKTLAEWQSRLSGGIGDRIVLHPLLILPERGWLYDRCDRRFVEMLETGAIEEVEALLERELSGDLPVMRAIGVPQIAAFLRGETDRETMISEGQQATRNYAKRQYTWFRGQSPDTWLRHERAAIEMDLISARILPN